jgi:hypothetical protein
MCVQDRHATSSFADCVGCHLSPQVHRMTAPRCRKCKAPLSGQALSNRYCPYCGASWPFGIAQAWMGVGVLFAIFILLGLLIAVHK